MQSNKTIDGLGDMVYEQLTKGVEEGTNSAVAHTTKALNNITFPKIKVEMDRAQLEQQLKLYSQRWEAIDNQRIAQVKKIAAIRKQLDKTAEGTSENVKVTEQLAQAEKKLNDLKMAAAQTDAQVVQLERSLENVGKTTTSSGNIARQAQSQLNNTIARTNVEAKKLGDTGNITGRRVASGMNKASKSTDKLGASMKRPCG